MRSILDEADFRQVRAAATGFIFNDFSRTGDPTNDVLHSAGCRWLARMNTGVPKLYFEPGEDPISWLNANRRGEGVGWKRCGTCGGQPGSAATGGLQHGPLGQGTAGPPATGAAPHHIVRVRDGVVEAWASRRLQFGAKGWQVELRTELAEALQSLEAADGQLLHGTFLSASRESFDVENALFYNLERTACFARACRTGLRFERGFERPPGAPRGLALADSYHRYELVPVDIGYRHWLEGATLARITTRPFGPANALTKPAIVWHASRTGKVEALAEPGLPESYGMRVWLSPPSTDPPNPAAVIKPLIDGLVSALHYHDEPSSLAEISERIARQVGIAADTAGAALTDRTDAVLGPRRLAWRWGEDGVQWNPADDRCVVGDVILASASQDGLWNARAEVFGVEYSP